MEIGQMVSLFCGEMFLLCLLGNGLALPQGFVYLPSREGPAQHSHPVMTPTRYSS